MGNTIWVDVEGRAKDEVPRDNSIMLNLDEQLARLSDKLGVAKLGAFFDYSVLAEAYAEEADEEAAEGVAATWFDPALALSAVRALRRHLSERPGDLGFVPSRSQQHWPDALMKELAHCEEVLERAASQGRKFRFLIVP
jgi:hypothetical protein